VALVDRRLEANRSRKARPDATAQFTPQNNQLMPKYRILGFKSDLRLERQGQNGQYEM
jgi:hypothetical protein